MNIIKFKDVIKIGDDFFNTFLKGKYAYWIHMRYIVSFYHMKHEGYVACEQDINNLLKDKDGNYPIPYGAPYKDLLEETDLANFIDATATDKANCTDIFMIRNNYTTDCNITIDELKKFRTWLATKLLEFDKNIETGVQKNHIFTDDETHVLQYYANGMYDDVVKYLSVFGNSEASLELLKNTTCGCVGSLNALTNANLSVCDASSIYKRNIYLKMVQLFSNVDFWQQFHIEFIKEFKIYIDNIIECNFSLTTSTYKSNFNDCGCTNTDLQASLQEILKRLSQSLQYIIDGNILGRKNYILKAFTDWSTNLYEKMEWV